MKHFILFLGTLYAGFVLASDPVDPAQAPTSPTTEQAAPPAPIHDEKLVWDGSEWVPFAQLGLEQTKAKKRLNLQQVPFYESPRARAEAVDLVGRAQREYLEELHRAQHLAQWANSWKFK